MTATATATAGAAARRVLRSPLVDLLVGPHGIDRYLELIRPDLTVRDARAEVVDVRHQTARSVTLTLSPNSAWGGFRAGQFVKVGVEIDGVRRTRTYSPASSQDGELVELTVTTHPGGLVSNHLRDHIAPGAIVHLGKAQGSFVLPADLPERIVPIGDGTLLEQAEAAGLSPDFGCRMGICHTCTCRKSAGAVRNVLTGEVSEEDDEDIQLCISAPAGDVALEL